jgi:multiple sugar transport system substrate-binding protein
VRRTALTLVLLATLALAACGGGGGGSDKKGSSGGGAQSRKPVKITVWNGFTERELGVFNSVLADFHRKYPWITVKSVGGVSDDKILAALRGGDVPDVMQSFKTDSTGAFCTSGGWIDLAPYIKQDKIDINVFPKAVQYYTQSGGTRCAMPMLADTYGLYYNKALFAKAGIKAPPRTVSELAADAKKLTTRKGDGSLDVVGFDPYIVFYESAAAHFGPMWGAKWTDAQGHSALSKGGRWASLLNWQKSLIDFYGYDKLVRWQAGSGDEFSASNAFERGKLAMQIDGEYREAFIDHEHPELKYGTAPPPVADDQPGIYGSGYITGNLLGIPKQAKHKDAAWLLMKYLALDDHAEAKLSNGLRNVPTTKTALSSSEIKNDPKFKVFLDVFANPKSSTSPITRAGSANQELFESWIGKWQAGKVSDLQSGLTGLDKQIDAQLANATGTQVP